MSKEEPKTSFLDELLDILNRAGFVVETISYPEKHRAIDIVGVRGNDRILIKVVLDTKHLSTLEVNDLKKASKAYNASPIIVAEKHKKKELEPDIVVKRKGVYIVSKEFLENYIYSGEKPLVYKKQGYFLVKINPRKFRSKRLQLGYSLGELAEELGVSRKAVYDYEHGKISVSLETAIRIAEILGEDVFEPIDILKNREELEVPSDKPVNRFEKLLSNLCLNVNAFYKLAKTPIDYILELGRESISIIYRGIDRNDFRIKVREAIRIARTIETREFIVRDEKDLYELRNFLDK